MCLIFYLTQLRLIFYLDYANGFFGDLVDSFNPLNVKTCSDLISDEENDNCGTYDYHNFYPNLFVFFFIF
jgi:hypothetical protein